MTLTTTILNPKWENIIADIIAYNLGLDFSATTPKTITKDSDNFVYIYNQNFKIPNTPGLKIEIGFGSSKILSSKSEIVENSSGGVVEIQDISSIDEFTIEVMSQDSSARLQKSFVLSALQSTYSQQQQEKNNFKIAKIPTGFLNLSAAEGGSMYNRFQLSIKAFVWYKKELSNADYFDSFGAGVYDEPTLESNTPLFTVDDSNAYPST